LRVSTTLTTGHTGLFKSDLFMEIFRVFREKKIEMPYPQQDVHVRSLTAPLVIASPVERPGRMTK
jgi:small-conductance mechanosensitive channel